MKTIQLSLTKKNSHTISLPLSQGSFAIGSIGMNKNHFDVLVDENLPINWDTFDMFFTGYGAENKAQFPYGDWPRFFHYSGNDLGFIQWTTNDNKLLLNYIVTWINNCNCIYPYNISKQDTYTTIVEKIGKPAE